MRGSGGTTPGTGDKQHHGTRGAYAKSAERRDTILDAALHVFIQAGYNAGTVRAVAKQAGMAEATVLHHFPSKPELLTALLQRREVQTRPR